jgi:hypothetical protein
MKLHTPLKSSQSPLGYSTSVVSAKVMSSVPIIIDPLGPVPSDTNLKVLLA